MKNQSIGSFFNQARHDPRFTFGAEDGFCVTRAHWICEKVGSAGVDAKKLWIYVDKAEPKDRFTIYGGDIGANDLFFRKNPAGPEPKDAWVFHCAVCYEQDGQIFVIDPAFQDEIVTLEYYLKHFSSSNGRAVKTKITHPSVFFIDQALNNAQPRTSIFNAVMHGIAIRGAYGLFRVMEAAGTMREATPAPEHER